MKSFILILALIAPNAFAASEPIREAVTLKNEQFAELITKALQKKIKPKTVRRVGGSSIIFRVKNGLECSQNVALVSGGRTKTSYACQLLPSGGWNFFGMEAYGSGDNEEFTLALFNALDVHAEREQGIETKQIALNVADPRGGTERNLLSCVKPSSEAIEMGFRPTCQLINAL